MKECKNKEANIKNCNCTYPGCERKGVCCECLLYHRRMKELPACFFSKAEEATYDRSLQRFLRMHP